jgi:succinate-semialdehyde dehydrogenase/glutarate-semialdehyde dehydrogenase
MRGDDDDDDVSARDVTRRVADAVTRVRVAQGLWAARPITERADVLVQVRKTLIADADALVAVATDELGKLPGETRVLDIGAAAIALSWAASAGPVALADAPIATFAPQLLRQATSSWRPRGVCALLSPWNYPYAIPMATLSAALVGGNGVVWKPSEFAPRCARALLDTLRRGGVPDDLVVIVDGDARAGAAVVNGDVDHVSFVGSSAAGASVAAACGARLRPCIIEGGGKAPAVVVDGADVERAARAIVFGGLGNGGQSCVAVERVYATAGVFRPLFERVTALCATTPRGAAVLKDNDARLRDAVVAVGGAASDAVVDVSAHPDSPLLRDECFGAVIPFVEVANANDAVARANAHPLQLAAYVFGPPEVARDIAKALRAPMVAIDDTMIHYALPQIPFGGVGGSGFGRMHGDEGLRALCVQQVLVEPGRLRPESEPWWPVAGSDGRRELRVLSGALDAVEGASVAGARRLGRRLLRSRPWRP